MLQEILIMVALAVLGIFEGLRLVKVRLTHYDPLGPGGFLLVISVIILACAAIYLAQAKKYKAMAGEKRFSILQGLAGRGLLLLFLYPLAASAIGYFLSSFLFFGLVQLIIFGQRSWSKIVVIGLAFAAFFYFGFIYIAGVPIS